LRIFWSKSRELLEYIPKRIKEKYWLVIIKRRPWVKRAFWGIVIFFTLASAGSYYYIFRYVGDLKDDNGQLLDFSEQSQAGFKLTSYVYADNNETIGRFFQEVRDPLKLAEVPEQLKNGLIAAEDQRFYSHPGVDLPAVIRAVVGNILRKFNIKYLRNSGASGIAQQYTRLYYGDKIKQFYTREHTLSRKVKEARIAIQLVEHRSRDKIIEDFMNMIYLGHGVNGVAEGALRYFGKDLRKDELTLREIAILVSMNKSPSLYCPVYHKPNEPIIDGKEDPEATQKIKKEYEAESAKEIIRLTFARDRYNWVLERMLDEGNISKTEFETTRFKKDEPLDSDLIRLKPIKNPAYGYGNRMVKEFLLSRGVSEAQLSEHGGFRIYTTINTEVQNIASEEFEKHLGSLNEGLKQEDKINGAFVIIETSTGNILALSGGNNFDETQYNRAMASRSPGSGFKPFTYAAAMEHYQKGFFDKICNCPFTRIWGEGKIWAPQNFREENPVPYGYIDLATGLIRSINLATLNLAMSLPNGAQSVVLTANSMGVRGNYGVVKDSDGNVWFRRPGYDGNGGGLEVGLPTVIGGSDVNMLELANAYTVFFRKGIYLRPTLIKEVKDSYGIKTIFKSDAPIAKEVLSDKTADKMVALMRAVTKIGTAKISMRDIKQQVACKTGTSNGPKDVSIWCGTPEIVIAFRFGNDDFSKIIDLPTYMRKTSGSINTQVTGGWVAGPLARRVIDRIYENRNKVEFSEQVENYLNELTQRYSDKN